MWPTSSLLPWTSIFFSATSFKSAESHRRQVHPDLFKGANKLYRPIPRNMLIGRALEEGADRAAWAKRIERERKRRQSKSQKLKAVMNYEFEDSPLKSIATLYKSDPPAADTGAGAEEKSPLVIEAKKTKKSKKEGGRGETGCCRRSNGW